MALLLSPLACRGSNGNPWCDANAERICAEAPAALRAAPTFRAARVALLLVGEPFRSLRENSTAPRQSCYEGSTEEQAEASLSYVAKVIEPLERCGAVVEVMYTFPVCPGRRDVMERLHRKMDSWFGPRVVAVANVTSQSMDHGWRLGHQMLAAHMATRRVSYDFVFQARHDVYLEADMFAWPADWSKLLFEQECALLSGSSCSCGFLSDYASRRLGRCHANHLLWIPQKYLAVVQRAVFALGDSETVDGMKVTSHDVIRPITRDLISAGQSSAELEHSIGFMFPSECGNEVFSINLMCREWMVYRPRRRHAWDQTHG